MQGSARHMYIVHRWQTFVYHTGIMYYALTASLPIIT